MINGFASKGTWKYLKLNGVWSPEIFGWMEVDFYFWGCRYLSSPFRDTGFNVPIAEGYTRFLPVSNCLSGHLMTRVTLKLPATDETESPPCHSAAFLGEDHEDHGVAAYFTSYLLFHVATFVRDITLQEVGLLVVLDYSFCIFRARLVTGLSAPSNHGTNDAIGL